MAAHTLGYVRSKADPGRSVGSLVVSNCKRNEVRREVRGKVLQSRFQGDCKRFQGSYWGVHDKCSGSQTNPGHRT